VRYVILGCSPKGIRGWASLALDPWAATPGEKPEDPEDEGEYEKEGKLRRDSNGIAHVEVEEGKGETKEGSRT
jgi:hypothetical protein